MRQSAVGVCRWLHKKASIILATACTFANSTDNCVAVVLYLPIHLRGKEGCRYQFCSLRDVDDTATFLYKTWIVARQQPVISNLWMALLFKNICAAFVNNFLWSRYFLLVLRRGQLQRKQILFCFVLGRVRLSIATNSRRICVGGTSCKEWKMTNLPCKWDLPRAFLTKLADRDKRFLYNLTKVRVLSNYVLALYLSQRLWGKSGQLHPPVCRKKIWNVFSSLQKNQIFHTQGYVSRQDYTRNYTRALLDVLSSTFTK